MPHTNALKVISGSGQRKRVYSVPAALRHRVEEIIQAIEDEKSIPAEKVLPELADDRLRPATMLRGQRHKAAMTQAALAAKLKIDQHHVSEMENGKRSISKPMARNLAAAFKCDYRLFL